MTTTYKSAKVLGAAFLFQFATSLFSGTILKSKLFVPGNIAESMVKIASHTELMRLFIFVDVLTALGVVFLGAVLFMALRKQNEKAALIALGFYIIEAAFLASSRSEAYSLMLISQEFVGTGQPANLLFMGNMALNTMDFMGGTLHMLAFCFGAFLFYFLIYKSRILPRIFSLWGLITLFPCLFGTIFTLLGFQIPFLIYLPYAPFELAVGIWLLIKGVKEYPPVLKEAV